MNGKTAFTLAAVLAVGLSAGCLPLYLLLHPFEIEWL